MYLKTFITTSPCCFCFSLENSAAEHPYNGVKQDVANHGSEQHGNVDRGKDIMRVLSSTYMLKGNILTC